MGQTIEPWERQKNEGEKPYEAFTVYMHMGLGRTVAAVAKELHKSYTIINRWRNQYDWDNRVLEYDNDLADAAKKEAVNMYRKEYAKIIERRLGIAATLESAALKSLKGFDEGNQVSVEESLTLLDKAAAIESAVFKEMLGINSVGAVQLEGDSVTNNLLEAILASTDKEIDVSDIPELEQTTDDSDDMVEPPES